MGKDYNPKVHHRQSIRLSAFDYSEPGYYFVTICTKERRYLFGRVVHGTMELNRKGYLVRKLIKDTERIRARVRMYSFIVMPNHMHMIIHIKSVGAHGMRPDLATEPRCGVMAHGMRPDLATEPRCGVMAHGMRPGDPSGPVVARGARSAPLRRETLSDVIRGIKSMCTSNIRSMEHDQFMQIWQRNYYERVIRSEQELFDKAMYIKNNPKQWEKDELHP